MTQGRLISKGEAVAGLEALGVASALVAEVGARYRGETIHLPLARRLRRAESARRLVARNIPLLRPIAPR